MRKYSLFSKGDVIRTNPEEGFYGIAVVLNDPQRIELSAGKLSCPLCHIAVTPLIFKYEPVLDELDIHELKPLIFGRKFIREDGTAVPWRTEVCIHIYTERNKANLPVIGKIDPSGIYDGELNFDPQPDRFHLCGDARPDLGGEAYFSYKEQSEKK
ncbi:MAG: hypothetical protein K6B74_05125 [Ruminococcus sp.]|nr:hypothetical protein [Ruminococcus sp.]